MTTLKLRALGWSRTAWCCDLLSALGIVSLTLYVMLPSILPLISEHVSLWAPWLRAPRAGMSRLFGFCASCILTLLVLQCWALCRTASRSMAQAAGDEDIWWTASMLYVNACLVLAGPTLSFAGLFAYWGIVAWLSSDRPFGLFCFRLSVVFVMGPTVTLLGGVQKSAQAESLLPRTLLGCCYGISLNYHNREKDKYTW